MSMKRRIKWFVAGMFALGTAHAGMIVSEFSATTLTVSFNTIISEIATEPQYNGLFLVSPFSNLSTQWYTGTPSLSSSTLTVGEVTPSYIQMFDNGGTTGDSLYFYSNPDAAPSIGTVITGTVTFSGVFDTGAASIGDFKLFQGMQGAQSVSNVIDTVPEPATGMIVALGGGLLFFYRRFFERA